MKIKDLNTTQLITLRKQIVLNSLYYSDYENDFDIDPHEVCDFFDGYLEECEYIPDENGNMLCDSGLHGDDYYNALWTIANDNTNLIDYFHSIEWED